MSVLKRRWHLVTFRLSTEEYDLLRGACIGVKARSLSDFTRSAVLGRMASFESPKAMLSEDLNILGHRLAELNKNIRDVSGQIGRLLGTETNDSEALENAPQEPLPEISHTKGRSAS